MKFLMAVFALALASTTAHASVESCARVAENAAYHAWYNPQDWTMGDVQHGATDVVWHRGDVVSYQVSIMYRKVDSVMMSWANYSVRVRLEGGSCRVLKVRKF